MVKTVMVKAGSAAVQTASIAPLQPPAPTEAPVAAPVAAVPAAATPALAAPGQSHLRL